MKNKDLTKKLSYEELGIEIRKLQNILLESGGDSRLKFAEREMKLQEYFLDHYDKYSVQERHDIMNQLNLVEKYLTNYIRFKF